MEVLVLSPPSSVIITLQETFGCRGWTWTTENNSELQVWDCWPPLQSWLSWNYCVGDLSVVWSAGSPCPLQGKCQWTSVLYRLGYVWRISSPVLQQHRRALPSCLQTTLQATRHARQSQVVPHHGHHDGPHPGADHYLWWVVVRHKHQEDLSDPQHHWRLADLLSPPPRASLSLQLGLSVR